MKPQPQPQLGPSTCWHSIQPSKSSCVQRCVVVPPYCYVWRLRVSLSTVTQVQGACPEAADGVPSASVPSYEDMSPGSMPLLDAFIKESMRLLPPIG